MKSYHGGDSVISGMYWSLRSGRFFAVSDRGALLPGEVAERYVRLPAPVGLSMGTMMGLAYVLFLPLVGIVGFPALLVYRLVRRSSKGARSVMQRGPKWPIG